MEEEKIKDFLKKSEKDNFTFKQHFYDKKEQDRLYLTEELVINSLKDIEKIEKIESQSIKGEIRYRITVKLSNRYNLVIITQIELERKNLNIITAWKTNRRWQNKMQK